MKRFLMLSAVVVFLVLSLAGWAVLSVSAWQALRPVSAAVMQALPATSLESAAAAGTSPSDLKALYARVSPSVVMIRVAEVSSSQLAPQGRAFGFRYRGPQIQQGSGSGFVWDSQGDIVTNDHVVDGADQIGVVFSDGTTAPARVVGTDPSSDLAVIRVNVPAARLHPLEMADSTRLQVGDRAIAIGSPFGQMNKMTTGTVSGLGRTLPIRDGNPFGSSYVIADLIQTDAPINPGNSGGVLLDEQGKVIGVTNAIESRTGTWAGIGFAIPSAAVQKVVPALIRSGQYATPWMGVSGTTLDPNTADALSLSADQAGAVVLSVAAGSPAETAGLRRGDVITAVDGQSVETFDDLVTYLGRSTQVGQTIRLTVLRGSGEQAVRLTLAARPG